jgi:hypothetical protein
MFRGHDSRLKWDSKEQVEKYVADLKEREGKQKGGTLTTAQDPLWDKDLDGQSGPRHFQ